MKNTKNLGLPIYDNPKSDLFKISDVNNAHTIIDETYETMKNAKDHIVEIDKNIPIKNADAEIVDARIGKTTLGEKIREIDSSLAQKANQTFVNVVDFGVVLNDETIDNTNSLQDAFEYAFENNKNIYFPTGVCVLDTCYISVPPNSGSIKIFGDGMTSVIKRKDNVVGTEKYRPLLYLTIDKDGGNFENIEICNLKFDGNARNNVGEGVQNELCASLRVCGYKDTARIENLKINNINFYDSVGDGVWIARDVNDSYVDNLEISEIYCYSRTRFRSDICISAPVKRTLITNCNVQAIEYEFDGVSSSETNLIISNVFTNTLDIAGYQNSLINLKIDNVFATGFTNFSSIKGTINNSDFTLKNDLFAFCKNVCFNNCKIYLDVDEEEKKITSFGFSYLNEIPVSLRFNQCEFILKTDLEEIFNGYIYRVDFKNSYNEIVFKECIFDKRAQNNLYLSRCGTVKLINNTYSANDGHAIFFISSGENAEPTKNVTNLYIDGGDFKNVSDTSSYLYVSINKNGLIETKNLIIDEKKVKAHQVNGVTGFGLPYTYISNTVILLDSELSSEHKIPGFKGDRYRLKNPISNETYEWVAINTSATGCNYQKISILQS